MIINKSFKADTPNGNGVTIAISAPMIVNSDKMTVEVPFKSYGGGYHVKEIGAFTYIGANASLRYVSSIGRFCSIAPNVLMQNANHDYTALSTSTFLLMDDIEWQKGFHSYYDIENKQHLKQLIKDNSMTDNSKIIIGNDVWIGNGAKILKGVHIGDGAVIGAGAVVTKDVQPYSIVAGVPAKEIKKRFSDSIIEALLEIKWWEYGPDILKGLDVLHPEMVISELYERITYYSKYEPIKVEFNNLENSIYEITTDGQRNLIYTL